MKAVTYNGTLEQIYDDGSGQVRVEVSSEMMFFEAYVASEAAEKLTQGQKMKIVFCGDTDESDAPLVDTLGHRLHHVKK